MPDYPAPVGVVNDPGAAGGLRHRLDPRAAAHYHAGVGVGFDKDEGMICPRCNVPLREMKVDEVVLDKCEQCGGVWFDFAELERVIVKDRRTLREVVGASPESRSEPAPGAARLICPRCSDELLTVHSTEHPDLRVEACLTCYGRWIDGRELGRVRALGLPAKLRRLMRRIL